MPTSRLSWAEAGEDAVAEFVRRLVFSVVIGDADMHLKNWSLRYPDRCKPVLSPGYNFVATLPYMPNDTLALSFGGSRSRSEIKPGPMRGFADTARIPASALWKIAAEKAQRAAAAWNGLEQAELLP
jgi:serine/threonine-protein kinase HipA